MSSKLDSDVCCRLQVAPSGESYGGNRRLAESNGSLLPGLWRDSLHVTCASVLYRVGDIASCLSKVVDFNPPHLHLAPPQGMTGDFWQQKTRFHEISCGLFV